MKLYRRNMSREKKTLEAMIRIYCRGNHFKNGRLCESCRALWDYALNRLDRCPLKDDKPACSECTIHCYQPPKRKQIIDVMRYAGPRMIWSHPVLAVSHLFLAKSSKKQQKIERPEHQLQTEKIGSAN